MPAVTHSCRPLSLASTHGHTLSPATIIRNYPLSSAVARCHLLSHVSPTLVAHCHPLAPTITHYRLPIVIHCLPVSPTVTHCLSLSHTLVAHCRPVSLTVPHCRKFLSSTVSRCHSLFCSPSNTHNRTLSRYRTLSPVVYATAHLLPTVTHYRLLQSSCRPLSSAISHRHTLIAYHR